MAAPTSAPAPAPARSASPARAAGSIAGAWTNTAPTAKPARNCAWIPRFRTPAWSGMRKPSPKKRSPAATRMTSPVHGAAHADGFQGEAWRARNWVPATSRTNAVTLPARDHTPPRKRPGITSALARRACRSRRRPRHFVDDRLARQGLRHGKPYEPARREDREPIGHPKRLLRILGEPEEAAPSFALQHERLPNVFLRLEAQPLGGRSGNEE